MDGLTSITFERGEMKIRVDNVPARICPNCGEVYVEEGIAVQLLQDAEQMSQAGELDGVFEYNKVNLRE